MPLQSHRSLRLGVLFAFSSLLLSACSVPGAGMQPPTVSAETMGIPAIDSQRSDPAVLAHIASDIPLNDRASIYDALEALPAWARENVILFTDDSDSVYGNKLEFIGAGVTYTHTADAGTYESASGNSLVFPEDVEAESPTGSACGVGGCTGVLHKVQSGSGYDFVSGNVSIPCRSSKISAKGGQNGFIYLGGETGNSQVDAGLQINSPGGGPAVPSSVQPFIRLAVGGKKIYRVASGDPHVACDQTIFMQFWPAQARRNSATFLTLYFSGVLRSGREVPVTLMTSVHRTGWSQVCIDACKVKRVTSIAVGTGDPQTSLGTWLGVTDPYGANPMPNVAWSNLEQGNFTSYGKTAVANTSAWSSYYPQDDPSNGTDRGLIVLRKIDDANEIIGINESGPKLRINARGGL